MDIIKLPVASFNGNPKNDIEYAFNVDDISEPIRLATDPVTDAEKALLPVYSGGYKKTSPNAYPFNTDFYISETLENIANLSSRLIILTIKEENGRALTPSETRVFDCNKITGQLSPVLAGADTKIFYKTGNLPNNVEYVVDETIDEILALIPSNGGASAEAIYVNQEVGDDTTGDGSISHPFKEILKGLQSTLLLGIPRVIVQATTNPYLVKFITWGEHTGDDEIMDGAILDSEGTVEITAPDWDDLDAFSNFNEAFMFHLNQAKEFNIHGSFVPIGDGGTLSTEASGAVINAMFAEYRQELGAMNGMQIRPKIGHIHVTVLNGDMPLPSKQGVFIGPGDGSITMSVTNGDMIFPKTFTGFTSNQTRGYQISNASTARKLTFRANNFIMDSSVDLSMTEVYELFYISSGGTEIEIYGNLIELNEPADGIFVKQAGSDGMLIVKACKSVKLFGNIYSKGTSCIQLDNNTAAEVEIHGNIHCERKCAIRDDSSAAGASLKLFGKVSSNGLLPTVNGLSNADIHFYGPIENKNSDPAAIGILNAGSNIIFHAGADIKVAQTPAYPMSNRAAQSYTLQGDIVVNATGFAPGAVSIVETWTPVVSEYRQNRDYKVDVDGTVFTVGSGAGTLDAMVTAMVTAIGTPAGVASVVDNTGSLTITWTAGTSGKMTDATIFFTEAALYVTNTQIGDSAGVTINGSAFTVTPPALGNEVWVLPDLDTAILTELKTDIDTDGTTGPLTTITKQPFSLLIEDDGSTGLDTVVPSGSTIVSNTKPTGVVTTDNYGFVGAMTDNLGGIYTASINANVEV